MKEEGFPQEYGRARHFRVAIFGSARISEGHQIYRDVYELSRRIAAEGMDVVTGGGPGLMKAANAGHQAGRRNSRVHSIGLNIRLPHEQKANMHLDIKKEFERFTDRLNTFMELSHAVVVAPGGIGTALELFYTWQLVQVKGIDTIPVVLFGPMWADLISWVRKWPLAHGLMDEEDLNSIFMAGTVDDVMALLKQFQAAYLEGEPSMAREREDLQGG